MRSWQVFVLWLAAASCGLASPSKKREEAALPAIWKPGVKWQIVIHAPIDITKPLEPADARVWDVDYFHSLENPDIIPYLKNPSPGVENVVICYVNIGAIESGEDDYVIFPKDALGKSYTDYPEYWIDIRRKDVLDFMKKRFDKAAEIGCDGIDGDNIDGFDYDVEGVDKTGWNLTQQDNIDYVQALADYAHSLKTTRGTPLMLGQKNANYIAAALAPIVDFAVLEDCQGLNGRFPGMTEPYCHDFSGFVTGEARPEDGRKLPVFELEYPGSTENKSTMMSRGDWQYYCNRDEAVVGNANFSMVIKHESGNLDGWALYCGKDESEGKCRTATLVEDF